MFLITYMITKTYFIYQVVITKSSVNKIILLNPPNNTHFYKGLVKLLQIHKTERDHFGQL